MSCALETRKSISHHKDPRPEAVLKFDLAEWSDSSDLWSGRFPRECQGDMCLMYTLGRCLELACLPWWFAIVAFADVPSLTAIQLYFVVIDCKSWSVLDMPMNVSPQSNWSYLLLPLRFSCRPTKVRQVKSCLELKLGRSKCEVACLNSKPHFFCSPSAADVRDLPAMLRFEYFSSLQKIEGKCLRGVSV